MNYILDKGLKMLLKLLLERQAKQKVGKSDPFAMSCRQR